MTFRCIALNNSALRNITLKRAALGIAAPRIAALRVAVLRTAVLVLAVAMGAPLLADARDDAKKQVEFGITVAARGLWREAIYRWQRAVEIDPTYAEAYNDLAIAYEHEGDLDKARQAYEKALQLAPSNATIKQNYELFKEINDRATSSGDK
jgi:Flp pilus assembly protein TadD